MNTAIAHAKNPVLMAEAMKEAVLSGRKAFSCRQNVERETASPSSPTTNLIE